MPRRLTAYPLLALLALVIAPAHGDSSPSLPAHGVLGTYVRGPHHLVPGTPAALRIATHWATAPEESGPIGRVRLAVRMSGQGRGQELFRGESDSEGLADALFQVPPWPAGRYTLTVTSSLGPHQSVTTHAVELQRGARLLLQSDKPLYQPGQTVHLRAVCLRPLDGHPVEAGGAQVLFEIYDPRGNRVLQETRPLSAFGIAATDAPLAEEILLGGYKLHAELRGDVAAPAELEVEVARYVLPRFGVALETDRAYYGPGARVRLSVQGRYFHGKALGGGDVQVRASVLGGSGLGSPLATLHGPLDQLGRARMEVALPGKLPDEGALRLDVEVRDTADHVERATREVPIAQSALAVEITAEAGRLLPEVDNHLWVVATRPDGAPETGAAVELLVGGSRIDPRRTDAVGVAEFSLRPSPLAKKTARDDRCGRDEVAVQARVTSTTGERLAQDRCVLVAERGGLLLRTDRALYPRGAPIRVEVQAPGRAGVAYIDLIKDRQIVSTAAVPLRDGSGAATLQPDERRFGTLALQAYHLGPDGRRVEDSRVIYIDRQAALRVEVQAQPPAGQESLRPGDPGQLRLRVVDATTGVGVRAALGVVMVDEALLALRPLREGATRTYFTLAAEAQKAGAAMRARPAGRTLHQLVEQGAPHDDDAQRQEAARILLAGAAPPWDLGWEIDPWALRKEAQHRQEQRLGEAVQRYARAHVIGEVDPDHRPGWRYQQGLPAAMARDGALSQRETRDAWDRPIPTSELVRVAGLRPFPEFAQGELDERLTAIYTALLKDQRAGRLPPDPAQSGKQAAVVIGLADLQRLVSEGRLQRGRLYDPWGSPLRVIERRRPVDIEGLRSRFVVAAAGPDRIDGSSDDLYAADLGCNDPSCHSGISVRGVAAAEAFAARVGSCGCAYGYGAGGGMLGARHVSAPSVRLGVASVREGVAGKEDRVRSNFPETLLWAPELLTDEQGRAAVDVTMADSITTWRLQAEALSLDGRLGQATAAVRVFQDFFVEMDLPPALTQHDEIAVPVSVSNYLKTAQRVQLELEDAPWFERLSPQTEVLDLAPSQVGVRAFRIRATGVGRQRLRCRARGQAVGDAVERAVEVAPDGDERVVSFQERLGPGTARHAVHVPADAVAGGTAVSLKIYPGMATHVLEGLESLLRVPSGCFEQTSSTTYPNALILQYLRRTRRSTPVVEKRAREYLQAGYQRLLSFEVRGGGFSWFGEAPASQVLTAYGLEEFHDMAEVLPVDRRVIERTQRWLLAQQRSDGSFAPDSHVLHDGVTGGLTQDVARITAFIAVSLKRTGAQGEPLARARAYVQRALRERPTRDPFTLALAAELLGTEHDALIASLWTARQEHGAHVSFTSAERTPTYGSGKGGVVETTALAARVLLAAGGDQGRADRAIGYLLASKDTLGNWHSTQATIRTLQALLAHDAQQGARARGALVVSVDGQEAGRVKLDGLDALHVVELPLAARAGDHDVMLRYEGGGRIAYQLLGRYYQPRAAPERPGPARPQAELEVRTELDDTEVKVGGLVAAQVRVSLRGREAMEMPIVTAGLPPGFDLDRAELESLVRARAVEKFQVGAREVVFYLRRLEAGRALTLPLHLYARVQARVQVPPPTVYEYYQPERRAQGAPVTVLVSGR